MTDRITTTVPVRFTADEVSEDMSRTFEDLAATLRSAGLPSSEQRAPGQLGTKDGGLIIALTIAGLAFTGIGTLVSALTYWRQQSPTMRVTVSVGDVDVAVDTNEANLDATVARLRGAITSATAMPEVQVAIESDGRDSR